MNYKGVAQDKAIKIGPLLAEDGYPPAYIARTI